MKSTLLLLYFCLTFHPHLFGQRVSVFVQAGVSSYGSPSTGGLGTGGGDNSWKTGPIVGLGARIALSRAFSAGATIEYSTHQYDPGEYGTPYDATNRVIYLNGIGQLRFELFDPLYGSILGGIGLAGQRSHGHSGKVGMGCGRPVRSWTDNPVIQPPRSVS